MAEPTYRRGALVVLVVGVAVGCLALGWWQWERFASVSGSGQNLGYALQWPLFAGFAVYAYRRFVRLENGEDTAQQGPTDVTELPPHLLPARPAARQPTVDEPAGLTDYNAYLAELATRDTGSDR